MNHGHKFESAEIRIQVGGEKKEIAVIRWERATNLGATAEYIVTVDYEPSYPCTGNLRSVFHSSAAIDLMCAKRLLNDHLKGINKLNMDTIKA